MGQNSSGMDFVVLTGPMELSSPVTADRPTVTMIGSSTEQDLHGDIMTLSALNDMCQVDANMTIWLNHDYTVPDSVFGSLATPPLIRQSGGVADLWIQVEVETANPKAATTYQFIQNGRKLGCSIGCQVLDYTIEEQKSGGGWDKPVIHITHVKTVEWSVVGIPANQRSWVENAIRGVFSRTLDVRLAPTVSSLFPNEYQRLVAGAPPEHQLKLASATRPEGPTMRYDLRRQVFTVTAPTGQTFATGKELTVPRDAISATLQQLQAAASSNAAQAKAAQEARAHEYHIGIKDGGSITKPSEWSNVPDSEWGDPVNYRYPMPDAAHARNALSRWGDASNRSQYSSAEQTIIAGRIKRRAKALGIDAGGEDDKAVSQLLTKSKTTVPVADDGTHAATSGTHTHAHSAYGAADAGDDGQHSHAHTHSDDADHSVDADHEHADPVSPSADEGDPTTSTSTHAAVVTTTKAVDPALSTAIVGIDNCADQLNELIDGLMRQLGIPDIDAHTGQPESDDDATKGAIAFLRRSLRLAADKSALNDEQLHHAQMAHDALKYMTNGLVCGLTHNGFQTPEQAGQQAQQARDEGNQIGNDETLRLALLDVQRRLAEFELAAAAKTRDAQAASTALAQVQRDLSAAQEEASALRTQMTRLAAQPTGRPTMLNRTIAADPAAVQSGPARPASDGTVLVPGLGRCTPWPASDTTARPALKPHQVMLMTNADIMAYLSGQAVNVPVTE